MRRAPSRRGGGTVSRPGVDGGRGARHGQRELRVVLRRAEEDADRRDGGRGGDDAEHRHDDMGEHQSRGREHDDGHLVLAGQRWQRRLGREERGRVRQRAAGGGAPLSLQDHGAGKSRQLRLSLANGRQDHRHRQAGHPGEVERRLRGIRRQGDDRGGEGEGRAAVVRQTDDPVSGLADGPSDRAARPAEGHGRQRDLVVLPGV